VPVGKSPYKTNVAQFGHILLYLKSNYATKLDFNLQKFDSF